MNTFRNYKPEQRRSYITLSTGEYYPDILTNACKLYQPVLETFSNLLSKSESSRALLLLISNEPTTWMRIQLCRVFRKYVSPETSVEMLKQKRKVADICNDFSATFRPINIVQEKFDARPLPDEAICAILWEYKDRGAKGYNLTEKFFQEIKSQFPNFCIWGPERAGADIQAKALWKDYPNKRPIDFVISSKDKSVIYAVGFARYDGDRGGAQEDDRVGGNKNASDELLAYFNDNQISTKIIFLNDGPGLLLGSMWEDYSIIEERHPDKIKVLTLRMISERLTESWLKGE